MVQLFPSIDLRAGRCVRLIQGDYDRQITYDADPLAVVEQYAAAGARWVHVVDLDAAKTGEQINRAVVEQIVADGRLRVQLGGGIRSTQTALAWLDAGVARVVVGTAALQNWDWFRALVHRPEQQYAGRFVLGLDAKDGQVAIHGWTQTSATTALGIAHEVTGWPLGAINYTDIARDGMLTGPNLPAIRAIAAATDVPVVASGGVAALDDLKALSTLPIAGVIVGRALYEEKFTVKQAIAALSAS